MKIVPEAIIDDGLFDVCIIEPFPPKPFCACFSPFLGGDMPDIPRSACARTKSLTIETARRYSSTPTENESATHLQPLKLLNAVLL